MHKKTICVAIVSVAAIALVPGFSLASNRGGNYDNGYRGNNYGDHSDYNYGNNHGGGNYDYNNYRSVRVIQDNSHRNAAAYPSYIPSNYYGNCNYNYNYNYGYNNYYQTGQTYYNSAAYCQQTTMANCPCQNQYYQNYAPVVYRTY
ncbi:MAG: hypothetical protein WCX69_02350 [Candidatus Paceibacterota bacterium]